jgi:hypothetical protein
MAVVVMVMVVPAAAIRPVRVIMSMAVRVIMAMGVVMTVVVMLVMVVPVVVMDMMVMGVMVMGMVMVVAMAVTGGLIIGPALGLERAHDLGDRAALPAHHLGQHVVVGDVDRVGGDFRRCVAVADVPGDAGEAQGVFGADLQQGFGRGAHGDKLTILQLQRIAIGQRARLVEVDQQLQTADGLQRDPAALPFLVVEHDMVDDAVGLDGGLAHDGGGTEHCDVSSGLFPVELDVIMLPARRKGACLQLA